MYKIKSRLTAHLEFCRSMDLKCNYCPLLFQMPTDLNTHIAAAHKLIRNRKVSSLKTYPTSFIKVDNTKSIKPDSTPMKIQNDQAKLDLAKNMALTSRKTNELPPTSWKLDNKNKKPSSVVIMEKEPLKKEVMATIHIDQSNENLLTNKVSFSDQENVSLSQIKSLKRKLKLHPVKTQVIPAKKYSPEKEVQQIKEYNCDICEEDYEDLQSLKNHFMAVHNSAMVFRCNKCFNRFEDFNSLKDHKLNFHNSS